MFKKNKKVIFSLLAITILSSSAASAASYNNNYYNRYIYNYNNSYNIEQNKVVDQYPTFTWEVINRWPSNSNRPSRPATPTNPRPSVSGISSIEMEVVRLVNIERQKEGLAPLAASSALSNVARKKSEDMAVNNYFSHTSPTYGSPSNMMRTFGINSSYSGENIAKGQQSAQSVVNAWMNSSGHRANIMNPSFKTIGVGHYKSSNGTNLWTQMFTN